MVEIGCEGYPIELTVSGVYFKSEKDISSHYAIIYNEGRTEGNCVIKIYETEIPQGSVEAEKIKTGDECKIAPDMCEFVFEVDIWGKYFFPKFNNDMQMYYDDRKYYGADYDSDKIFGIAECFNFAIAWGLQKAGIKPY